MGNKLIQGVNDLETWCKENNREDLLDEWDYEENGDLKPCDVTYGMSKKIWWKGLECGHKYQASLNKRTSDKTGCPYCCKSHARILQGFNDLATTNPELLKKWDYHKNEISPTNVMKGSHKKIWWICDMGHSYQATIYHIVNGRGCPVCRKEAKTSFPEQAVYYYIKKYFPDAINSERTILEGKELDIYIPSKKVAVEFDGSMWHQDINKDINKNYLCLKKNITLIRIRDNKCPILPYSKNVHIIIHNEYTDDELTKCITSLFDIICYTHISIDLKKDRTLIYNNYIKSQKDTSLGKQYPNICKDWNYEKNGKLTPFMVSLHSAKKVWWKCFKCGNSYQSIISSKVQGHGCPYCNSNRLLSGYNDLASVYPTLVPLFDNKKNNKIPQEISAKDDRSFWWICSKGHSYKTRLQNVIKNLNNLDNLCPICSNSAQKVNLKQSEYTLDKTNPELLQEWDYKKNKMKPNTITRGYKEKIWWICPNGHSYQARISNKNKGDGCPYCGNKKVLQGFNDLTTTNPELLEYWNYEKNTILPTEITRGSSRKVWWKCSKGHTHLASVYSYKPNSCQICKGYKKVINIDTGKIYSNATEAANAIGLKQGDTIYLACKGKQKLAGGYHWKYVNEKDK